ncbi:unnamed protein product, partial [Hapterophycus canaliculatus]
DEEGGSGSGKRTAGVGAAEGVVTRRGGLRSGGVQDRSAETGKDTKEAGGIETVEGQDNAEGQDPSTSREDGQEKAEGGAAQCGAAAGEAKGGEKPGSEGHDDAEHEANGKAQEVKREAGEEADDKGKEGENESESLDGDKETEGDGQGETAAGEGEGGDGGDVAEGEAKVKEEAAEDGGGNDGDDGDDDEDDDAAGTEAERVDIGAWAAAAPASRSPVVMVRHVDALEVSPEAICHLFGLYGDVMKVKLVASRGMALVQMRYPVQAVNAQRLLDQTPLSGMTLEVKASSQWTINDPTAADFSGVQGLHRQALDLPIKQPSRRRLRFSVSCCFRYQTCPSPEDKRYRDSMSPPCPTLVVDNVPPDVSAEAITSIFAK